MGFRRRDPRQARYLTWVSLCWMLRHRAYTPWHLVRYWRLLRLRLTRPHIVTEGMVFLGRGVTLTARRGYGRLILGRWSHVGDGTALRAHEGTLRIGDKCVVAADVTVNSYLDVEIGAASMIADDVYITDFDHVTTDTGIPMKDQGIVKSPVRIGPDCWLGTKVVVTRGVRIGRGCVVGAGAVVTRDLPDHTVAAGVPARPVRSRRPRIPAGPASAPFPVDGPVTGPSDTSPGNGSTVDSGADGRVADGLAPGPVPGNVTIHAGTSPQAGHGADRGPRR